MDLQVTQENLNKALGNVARVATGRTTLPILSNVLIKTENSMLKISATNLDIAISQTIGTKIKKEGSITVPARLFQDFVNNLPKTTISLRQDDHKLLVSAGNYKSVINGSPVDEYPVMPAIQSGETFEVSALEFKKALQQVIFAASSDEARPILTGVFISSDDKKMYIAATDSYRLAEKQLKKNGVKATLLIPNSALHDILRIIGDHDDVIEVLFDDQQVLFKVGDVELIARLIDGTYPDYQKLIPQTFSNTAKVNKQELVTITKISGLFSRENAGSITVTTNEEDKTLSIDSIASQVGENTARAEGVITGSGSITLNSRYLLEGLQALEGDEVEFCFNGKLEPIVIRSPEKSDYLHVIMPLKS